MNRKISFLSGGVFERTLGMCWRSGKYFLFAFLLFTGVSCSRDDDENPVIVQQAFGETDLDFMTRTAYFNHAEIAFAQVALERSQNEEVRAFAQNIIDEHTAAQTALEELAVSKGITLPQGLTEGDQDELEELREENLEAFDEEYTENQARRLRIAEEDFQDQIESGDDADIVNYARTFLPTISANQDEADRLEDVVD